MKCSKWIVKAALTGLASAALMGTAFAQAPPAGRERRPLPLGAGWEMLGFELAHGGKLVKGSPFSAVAVSETTHTLADGNLIHRKTSVALFRDTEGRVRREVSLPAIGPLATAGPAPQFIVISDPVVGARYTLMVKEKVARKASLPALSREFDAEKFRNRFREAEDSGKLKTEPLGTQTMDGLAVEGTRITRIIPAGAIGNDKPIEIVSERWYSPDLQMVVQSRRSDPRFGETTYKLTNIQRSEPAAALFQVPSDFRVQEGSWRKLMPGKERANDPGPNGAAR